MGLIYYGASIYGGTYSGNYLMHARTVGSRNGISNTPGYKAKGELAKGRWVNGVYIPAERDTFNARVGNVNASLAKKNLRAGNAGGTARYAGQTVRSYSKQAGSDIRRAADIAYNNTREFVTGEHAKAYLDSLLEQKKDIKRTIYVKGASPDIFKSSDVILDYKIAKAQKLYDRTLPGMIDKAKYVGSQAWPTVKNTATAVMSKARDFIEGLWNKAKAFGGSALGKIQSIATETWSKVKEKGSDALKWGRQMLDKVVGVVKEFATGEKAKFKMGEARNEEEFKKAQAEYNRTLPGMAKNAEYLARRTGKEVKETAKTLKEGAEMTARTAGESIGKAAETAGKAIGSWTEDASINIPRALQSVVEDAASLGATVIKTMTGDKPTAVVINPDGTVSEYNMYGKETARYRTTDAR